MYVNIINWFKTSHLIILLTHLQFVCELGHISKTPHYFLVLVAYLIILGAIQANSRESPRTIQVYYMLLGHYLYK